MFGTTEWPKIDFDLSGVLQNAQKLTGKLSISGVQPKLSMKRDKNTNQLISEEKIHQEDFSQILQQDKYKGSVEQIGRKLREISTASGYDQQLFFERVLFNFILGNGDAHLKNYSISYRGDTIRLSPAYDIVCSKLVIPEEEESALNINGKKNRLSRLDFNILAEYLNVPIKVRYEKFERKFKAMEGIIKERLLHLELAE